MQHELIYQWQWLAITRPIRRCLFIDYIIMIVALVLVIDKLILVIAALILVIDKLILVIVAW